MPTDPANIESIRHNEYAWNWAAKNGNRWSTPVSDEDVERARRGDFELSLTPCKKVPRVWLGDIKNRRILGLASGGGQQGPILAAAGANVTIADISEEQLALDQKICDQYGFNIMTVHTAAHDLSMFGDASFDLIFNPCSNCFFPDLRAVWHECARVLRSGGRILFGFINPVSYLFDFEQARSGRYILKYKAPYDDLESLSPEEKTRFLYKEVPHEFGHSLTSQLSDLMQSGFVIRDMYEDNWGEADGLDKYFPSFIAVHAERIG